MISTTEDSGAGKPIRSHCALELYAIRFASLRRCIMPQCRCSWGSGRICTHGSRCQGAGAKLLRDGDRVSLSRNISRYDVGHASSPVATQDSHSKLDWVVLIRSHLKGLQTPAIDGGSKTAHCEGLVLVRLWVQCFSYFALALTGAIERILLTKLGGLLCFIGHRASSMGIMRPDVVEYSTPSFRTMMLNYAGPHHLGPDCHGVPLSNWLLPLVSIVLCSWLCA